MRMQTAAAYRRTFTDLQLQINWKTVTLDFSPAAAANTYPVLHLGTAASSRYTFTEDCLIMGAHMSVTWITAAANETNALALAPVTPGRSLMNLLGPSNVLLKSSITFTAAVTAGSPIERDPGFVFPAPFNKFVQQGTAFGLFGTKSNAVTYQATCTVYYVTVPDFQQFMQNAIGEP